MKGEISAGDKRKDIPSRGTGQAKPKSVKTPGRCREERMRLWGFVGGAGAGHTGP